MYSSTRTSSSDYCTALNYCTALIILQNFTPSCPYPPPPPSLLPRRLPACLRGTSAQEAAARRLELSVLFWHILGSVKPTLGPRTP